MIEFKDAYMEFIKQKDIFKKWSWWRHVNGNLYYICNVAIDEPSLEIVIIYKDANNVVWVRPIHEFKNRFTRIYND